MAVAGKNLTVPFEHFSERLAAGLADSGYAIFPGLVTPAFAAEIRAEMERLRAAGEFRPAGIAKGTAKTLAPDTRGDGIRWFSSETSTETQSAFASILDAIREALNAKLYLGLWDWEGHYAVYPPGTFYRRHLDRFQNDSKRTVSIVFFFNPDWEPEFGGSLCLETDAGEIEIHPESGTAVFFLSGRIPHEVRATTRYRYSFAGWLRTRA